MHGSPIGLPIPRAFDGEDIFIVAGGASLEGFDFERLRGRVVIAINRSHQSVPFAKILYFTDPKCWHWYEDTFRAHRAPWKLTSHPANKEPENYPGVLSLARTGARGLDLDPGSVRHGNNSGYAAINVAVHFRPRKIILLGYDMKPTGDRVHHHPEHPVATKPRAFDHMVRYFDGLVEPLSDLGIEVLNTSMDSRLTCFPKVPIERFL